MKIIEALKKVKDLNRKAEDLRDKVKKHCCHSSQKEPEYGKEQQQMVDGWIQAHRDIVKEILNLRIAIQKTNLSIMVPIDINGKTVTKSIAEWVHRRRDLANLDRLVYDAMMGDKGIQEGKFKSPGDEIVEIKIVRYYSPKHRDEMRDLFIGEPSLIDGTLEVVNATTDLVI